MDKKSYFIMEYLACCWYCKFYQDMICIDNSEEKGKPAHPLGLCRNFRRTIK